MGSQEECRFAHLLQPIRDLAANWDINIASDLEEYLGVLEHITFSFDGGPTLNFAEAALLIQGSACVYSKKVEHLHGLVHQALTYISEKRKKGPSEGQEQHDAKDDFDDEETFLNLDDVLEEAAGIDLDEVQCANHEHPIRPPAALLALEEAGGAQADGCSSSYRIATCSVHKSGALLLEASDGFGLDIHLQRRQGPEPSPMLLGDDWQDHGSNEATAAEEADGGGAEEEHYDPGEGFGDDDCCQDTTEPHEPHCAGAGGADAPSWLQEPEEGGRQTRSRSEPAVEKIYDPYEPLDPHDPGNLPLRPFRKLKPRRHRQRHKAPVERADYTFAPPPPPPAGPFALCFPEFGYVLRARAEAQRAERAQLRGAAQHGAGWEARRGDEPGAAEPLSGFMPRDAEEGPSDEAQPVDDGYLDDAGMGGFGEDDDNDDMAPNMEDLVEAADANRPDFALAALAQEGGGEPSYEERCRAHVEALMAAAAAAEVQTELAVRVAGWRAKIGPALAAQDARGEFDIHEYGAVILQDLALLSLEDPANPGQLQLGNVASVDFHEVARKEHKWQVSRVFSSLLQLVNNGSVVILQEESGCSPFQPFCLRLQSLDRPHKHFADYRAPSFLQNKNTNVPAALAAHHDDAKPMEWGEAAASKKPTAARQPAKRRKARIDG